MRWLADECVDAILVARLREAGHDVGYIIETAARATDAEVMALADQQGRLLLTEDKDFGDLVFRRGRLVPGLVLLRINPARHVLKWQRLEAVIFRFGERLLDHYTVVEESRFRSRQLRA